MILTFFQTDVSGELIPVLRKGRLVSSDSGGRVLLVLSKTEQNIKVQLFRFICIHRNFFLNLSALFLPMQCPDPNVKKQNKQTNKKTWLCCSFELCSNSTVIPIRFKVRLLAMPAL